MFVVCQLVLLMGHCAWFDVTLICSSFQFFGLWFINWFYWWVIVLGLMAHWFVQVFNSPGFGFYMVRFCTIFPIDFWLSRYLVLSYIFPKGFSGFLTQLTEAGRNETGWFEIFFGSIWFGSESKKKNMVWLCFVKWKLNRTENAHP